MPPVLLSSKSSQLRSGQMYGYLVGAEDRWEYLVAGDPLRQIGEAEPEATQGEVILSPEAWELASTDFLATKTPQVSVVKVCSFGFALLCV